jgi:site-specific recombinase XerD
MDPTDLLKVTLNKIDGAYAPNTIRAYRVDMEEFVRYSAMIGQDSLPAQPGTVASFVQSVSNNKIKSATIRRKISSISAIHRLSGLADPTKCPEAKLAVRKMHRQMGRIPAQAYGVSLAILEKLISDAGDDLRALRDKALLLVGFDTLRRRSELVSLRVDDLEWTSGGGGTILLRRSKTDQDGSGKYLHLTERTCQSIRDWHDAADIDGGFVLRGVNAANKATASLGEGQISRIYKRLARQSGISENVVKQISGHSLRVGGAQEMLKHGASLPQIMVKGGWSKTDTVVRYIEKALVQSPHLSQLQTYATANINGGRAR